MKLFVTDPDGKRYDISSIVKDNIQLSSDIDNITAQMDFELAYNYREGLPYHPIDMDKGAYFAELYDNTETLVFQGVIPKITINAKNPKFHCYDPAFYVSRVSEIFQFDNLKADECIKKMLEEFSMPVGTLESCDAKIVAVNNENNALTQSRMDNIKSFLDTEIVTDAEFTITTINNKVVNLDITAEIFDEYDEKSTKELIKNTLNKYFLDNLFKKEKLFYTSIIDELVEIEAFKDVFDVKLENAKENIDLSDEDLVTLGNINLIIKNK